MKPFFLLLLGSLVILPLSADADDIKVAMSFDASGGRQTISMSPHGGITAIKSGQITNREVFTMQNLTGDKIQDGAQVKIRFGETIWYRTEKGTISRTAARGSKGETTIFELKDLGGQYRIMAPGGGWLAGPSEGNNKSLRIVENEEDAVSFEFIENPLPENP